MIAAVVVTYSAPAEVLRRCLLALLATAGLDRIVVVANGAHTDLGEIDRGRVQLLRSDNRGYGAAVNLGVSTVPEAESIVVLNDDVVVQPGWLAPLVHAIGSSGIGAAQPVLVTADHSVVTSLGVQLDRFGAGSDVGDGGPLPSGRGLVELEIFNGGAVLFDAEFLRATGGFDERFFLYYEDVDLALRGRELGWSYRLVPASIVEHRRGTSTGEHGEDVLYFQERNRLWTAFRWAPSSTVFRAIGLSIRRLRRAPMGVHVRALAAGLGGAPRCLAARRRSHRSR